MQQSGAPTSQAGPLQSDRVTRKAGKLLRRLNGHKNRKSNLSQRKRKYVNQKKQFEVKKEAEEGEGTSTSQAGPAESEVVSDLIIHVCHLRTNIHVLVTLPKANPVTIYTMITSINILIYIIMLTRPLHD